MTRKVSNNCSGRLQSTLKRRTVIQIQTSWLRSQQQRAVCARNEFNKRKAASHCPAKQGCTQQLEPQRVRQRHQLSHRDRLPPVATCAQKQTTRSEPESSFQFARNAEVLAAPTYCLYCRSSGSATVPCREPHEKNHSCGQRLVPEGRAPGTRVQCVLHGRPVKLLKETR